MCFVNIAPANIPGSVGTAARVQAGNNTIQFGLRTGKKSDMPFANSVQTKSGSTHPPV
jgi:hypothetical protein